MQYDKRGDTLLLEEADLVGIEVPKVELTNLILNVDARLNVISVVGMGGLGKTTLVKTVYDDDFVKTKFGHHVWITISESFKLEELFKDVIRQLFSEENRECPEDVDGMEINRLKRVVKDFLQTKKYIVVFDDVWQRTHWDAIHLAFPRNQFGSRVVITTRNLELGKAVSVTESRGFVYSLRPLPNPEAMQLFCRKAFSGRTSCPRDLIGICEQILRACQGLPLAVEVIGSVLSTRRHKKDWELFYNSLGTEMKRNSQLDPMMKLLSLSYYDLPNHVKICFLYLSIFPEDAIIWNNNLAELWIVEGFVDSVNGMTVEEVANRYLNELVDRCLVQVALTDKQGRIKAIRVHDIIRHIILLKASEQNITTIFRGQEGMSFPNNVRRLALHGSINDHSEHAQSYCKSILSLILWKYIGGNISEPCLSSLLSHGRKLLKVLDLTDAELERIPDEIFKLFHLRYLNLDNTKVKYVPKSIGMLRYVRTLTLSETHVTELPAEVQKLQHLRHLILGRLHPEPFLETFEQVQGVKASFRIGNLKSLQQLIYIEAVQVKNIRTVTEIAKLVHLRILGITKLKREDGKELCFSFGNLTELCELIVYSANEEEVIDFRHFKSSDLPRIEKLILVGRLEKYPEWISSLVRLTRIDLRYSKLSDEPLECLHDLPNLVILNLTWAYQGESLSFKAGGFPRLNNLHLRFLQELRYVTIEENAMPFLQQLLIRDCLSMEDLPVGIENLMRLQELEFSNMSNDFLTNLDKQREACKKLKIPRVVISSYTDGRWLEVRHLNKVTGTWSNY
ncbi:antimicrobial response protein [Lithospermum erythrorhizon]|uniref:Antimicrobial response protein n=1 Tax=Lithospermum erythrorhizon TaxID=34254 RepID=A0AAV3PD09_LITER